MGSTGNGECHISEYYEQDVFAVEVVDHDVVDPR